MRAAGGVDDRDELAARLALLATPGISGDTCLRLLQKYDSAMHSLPYLQRELGADTAAALRSEPVRRRVRRALHAIDAEELRVLAHDAPGYPQRLLERLPDPPPLLFARGNLALLDLPCLAVVGSRRASTYGLDVATEIGGTTARAGACVVSGLALGIDAAAHEAALAEAGATIAVLGCGVDVYYPRRNTRLQDRIAVAGLLLSEFLPGEPPRAYQFPHRNRVIAALSRAVIVVEAGLTSGAIRTAVHAIDHDIPVYGVPNAIDREGMQGILKLYEDGVPPFTSTRDVLESHGLISLGQAIRPAAAAAEVLPADPTLCRVLEAIAADGSSTDEIARGAGLAAAEALGTLLALELDGHVVQLPGGRYRRSRARRATAGAPAGTTPV